ncbi:MAG: hypothetical protein Q4C60_03590 [Eubacteriales bacterium]|nr:hypothetical protein [Eubacteriales bacterium]
MTLRERVEERRRLGSAEAGAFRGSRAYRNFFEGYEEVAVPRGNGRGVRIERIYRGSYYVQEGSDHVWLRRKVLCLLLYLASFLCFAAAAWPSYAGNTAAYTVLAQAVAALLYLWLFTVVCSYIVSGRRMTVSKYKRAVLPMTNAAAAVSFVLLLTAAMQVVYCVINRGGAYAWTGAAAYLAAAGFAALLYRQEKNCRYRTE